MFAATCKVAGAVPLAGPAANHAASVATVKFSVPPPVFVMLTGDAAGFDPPSVAEKFRLRGLTPNVGTGAFTVTAALADFVESATLVAVTVTVLSAVTVGAVKSPALVIVPAVAVHVTPVFPVFSTCAVNCCMAPELTVAVVGETVTAMAPACVANT
jgi:hypothetical protein